MKSQSSWIDLFIHFIERIESKGGGFFELV